MVIILIICDFSYEILYESSIHLFFKSKENMGERRDAAFASCWGSAAMETKPIGPECAHVPLFTVLIILLLSVVEGREYLFLFLFFLATH